MSATNEESQPRGWKNPSKVLRVITDLGADPGPRTYRNVETGEVSVLPRFGVWCAESSHKPEVIDTGDDLEALAFAHGIEAKIHDFCARVG